MIYMYIVEQCFVGSMLRYFGDVEFSHELVRIHLQRDQVEFEMNSEPRAENTGLQNGNLLTRIPEKILDFQNAATGIYIIFVIKSDVNKVCKRIS